jgi:hypothetical protein
LDVVSFDEIVEVEVVVRSAINMMFVHVVEPVGLSELAKLVEFVDFVEPVHLGPLK